MTTLTIDLDAIAANWRSLAARHAAPTAAVVKADAYGLGAQRIGAHLHAAGVRDFFVAYPGEGEALRPHVGNALIGILNGFFPGEAQTYIAQDLAPVLGNAGEITAWRAHASHLGRALPALLHVDTGMNRLGLSQPERARLADHPEDLQGLEIRYIMTHLSNAEMPDDTRNLDQVHRFAEACAQLPPFPRSIANSSGIFLGSAFRSDLARPRAALYGINPTPGLPNPMRPAMRLTARVLTLRDIPAGEPVGLQRHLDRLTPHPASPPCPPVTPTATTARSPITRRPLLTAHAFP